MKCEICHQADAETAFVQVEGDGETELYVCHACAERERRARQKKRERTRKQAEDAGVSISGEGDMENPPPLIGAILNAIHDMGEMVKGLEHAGNEPTGETARSKEKYHTFPTARVEPAFRIRGLLHLEGLHLIGELEASCRALHALDMNLTGLNCDGLKAPGHVFRLDYKGSVERAKIVCEDLLREERNARIRLAEEMNRVFGDAICRALAILKNCRLLSSGEYFDLLSPLRLAALEGLLEGITLREIEELMSNADTSGSEDALTPEERERIDAERADEVNARFEEVIAHDIL